MYVYRIENNKGIGPYIGNVEPWQSSNHDNKPNPIDESLIACRSTLKNYHYYCGFKDLNQLQAWFTPCEITTLSKQGFKIKRMKAYDIRIGKQQVIFKKVV